VSDPTRWRILHLLAAEELCTTHLHETLGLRQNLVSHHLRVLRDAGLVKTSPCGRYTYYRLSAGSLDDLGQAIQSLATSARAVPGRRAC